MNKTNYPYSPCLYDKLYGVDTSRERDGTKMPYAYKVYLAYLRTRIDHRGKKHIGSAPVGPNRMLAQFPPSGVNVKGRPSKRVNQLYKPIKQWNSRYINSMGKNTSYQMK